MGKQQASKRARDTRKQAKFADMARNTGHPSHLKRGMCVKRKNKRRK